MKEEYVDDVTRSFGSEFQTDVVCGKNEFLYVLVWANGGTS